MDANLTSSEGFYNAFRGQFVLILFNCQNPQFSLSFNAILVILLPNPRQLVIPRFIDADGLFIVSAYFKGENVKNESNLIKPDSGEPI